MNIPVEVRITQVLGPLFGERVFPDVAPSGASLPRATYQQVGGRSLVFLEGGAVKTRNYRIQVNVWAKTRAEASPLMRAAGDALKVADLRAVPQGEPVATYDTEVKLYGAMQDFMITWDD